MHKSREGLQSSPERRYRKRHSQEEDPEWRYRNLIVPLVMWRANPESEVPIIFPCIEWNSDFINYSHCHGHFFLFSCVQALVPKVFNSWYNIWSHENDPFRMSFIKPQIHINHVAQGPDEIFVDYRTRDFSGENSLTIIGPLRKVARPQISSR